MDDVQPVIQVAAEGLRFDAFGQHPVRGRDDADVDADMRLLGTDALHFAGFQEAQQHALHARAGFTDFVEKHGAAVGGLENPGAVTVGAGEAASCVTEEFRFEERLGHRGAVDRHHWRALATACRVDHLRDDFLARPAFTRDQNLCVRTCSRIDFVAKIRKRGARPDEARENFLVWHHSGDPSVGETEGQP
jgi:hypothetical protein